MKMFIYADEWYPVFSLETTDYQNGATIEVDKDFQKKYTRVMRQFKEIQDHLRAEYNKYEDD